MVGEDGRIKGRRLVKEGLGTKGNGIIERWGGRKK